MTLPASFPLSMSQIATELGLSLPLSMNHAWVLALAGKSALPASFSDLLGKSGRFDGNILTQDGGTFPVTVVLNLANAPWFGGHMSQLATLVGGGRELVFSLAPNWSGNISVKNNTTGVTAIYTKTDSVTWNSPTYNLGNIGDNDSYTILPSN